MSDVAVVNKPKKIRGYILALMLRIGLILLTDRQSANYVLRIAKEVIDNESSFARRGRIYRTVKQMMPEGTNSVYVSVATEIAIAIDALKKK